ncbi:xylulokinase [Candidatus Vecturithrix granuli]|uniref:Xylulokinase n=1 Tax=Vecturithrix granuli TaxID=1499967 RepID=A0A081C479_VECG1|nr:xylulokinase [Candidatus Vecturithrix granuli]
MNLFIGLDVGTSAVKGVLMSEEGDILAQGKRLTQFLHPQTDFIELSPEDHYRSVCDLIRELASSAPPGSSIAALSMAAASGNTLLTDDAGQPLTNIISWLDTRAVQEAHELLPDFDFKQVHPIVGWPWVGSFPLGHLAWLKAHAAETYHNASHYGMNSDYLLFRLSGKWGMDASTATTFYLQDQCKRRWHIPYLERLKISEKNLSALLPSGSVLGALTSRAAKDTNLSEKMLVVLGAFDHPCAARGTGMLQPGDLLLSCGTSWVGFYPLENRDLALSQTMLIDPFLTPNGPWGAMFSLARIGTKIDWYINHLILQPGDKFSDRHSVFNALAQQVPPGANGLYINPCRDISELPEKIAALNTRYTREEIARAVMEGTAFEMRRKIKELTEAGIPARRIAMVGGPAESPIWPRIVAEITGLELRLINGQNAGAVGAAILAGIGAGVFRDEIDAFSRMGAQASCISPSASAQNLYASLYETYILEAG